MDWDLVRTDNYFSDWLSLVFGIDQNYVQNAIKRIEKNLLKWEKRMNWIRRFLESRFWALAVKEVQQILKNKQFIFLLLFPPTIQLLILGFALDPSVTHLSLGVLDYSRTEESRELVSALTENDIFWVKTAPHRKENLVEDVRTGKITTGLIIPPEFRQDIADGKTAKVQVFIDGVNANTAGIASGYMQQIVREYSRNLNVPPPDPLVNTQVRFLYNPGLMSTWFFVPGVMGLVLTLTGSLVSSITLIREKDVGTLEQLLMTPAAAWEILAAKIAPLFVLLMGDVFLAAGIGLVVFHLPFRGNFAWFLLFSGLYVVVAIGLGMLLATLSKTQQQVVLTSFFFNVPIIQLSGAVAPIESMPLFFRVVSFADPLRHYVAIARNLILKGTGIEPILPNAAALAFFAIVLLGVSINRFRAQLS